MAPKLLKYLKAIINLKKPTYDFTCFYHQWGFTISLIPILGTQIGDGQRVAPEHITWRVAINKKNFWFDKAMVYMDHLCRIYLLQVVIFQSYNYQRVHLRWFWMVPSDTALFWSSMVTILKNIASLCPSPLHLSGLKQILHTRYLLHTWYLLHLKNGREQNRQYIYICTWITGMMYITKIDTIQHINTMHTDIYIYILYDMAKALAWQVCDGLCPRIHLLSLMGAQTRPQNPSDWTERS